MEVGSSREGMGLRGAGGEQGRGGKERLLRVGVSPQGEGARCAPLATGGTVVPSVGSHTHATHRTMPDHRDAHGLIPGPVYLHLRGKRYGPLAADSQGLGLQGTMGQAPGTWRVRLRAWLPWALSGKRVLDLQGQGVGSEMRWSEEGEPAGENVT